METVGYGGPQMRAAGCQLHEELTRLAVMWFARVLANVATFWNLVVRADRYFQRHRPDAVVLIDYPGFNWWIARRAKAHGIPVFYYSPPQVWAWARWRVKKMRRFVDHILCGLPFEAAWYEARGCRATYVGHPFFDALESTQRPHPGPLPKGEGGVRLVTILPGSRNQEVEKNLRGLLRAASRIAARVSNVQFAIASFKPHQAEMARAILAAHRAVDPTPLEIEIHCGKTAELIAAAHSCLAVSGSVSLELMYHATPSVVLYTISRIAYFVQSFFRKVKYITLVNLLNAADPFSTDLTPYRTDQPDAHRVLFPEYLAYSDKSAELADHVVRWLTDETAYRDRIASLVALRDRIAQPGAAERSAAIILKAVDDGRHAQDVRPRTHHTSSRAAA
jgi:lipid-A-disaccharide synthase